MTKPASLVTAALRGSTQLAWFVVVPALLAGLTFRHLVPAPRSGATGVLNSLSQAAAQYAVPFAVLLFVYFAVLLRYWARRLPGADSWLPAERARGSALKQAFGYAIPIGVAVLCALGARTLYTPCRVLSASMLPTLEPGALLLARQTTSAPRRGDVIVLQGPEPGAPPLVKRVIGLPGDVVRVNMGHPVINDWVVPGCNAGRYAYLSERGMTTGTLVVEFLDDAAYLTIHSVPLSASMAAYEVPAGEVFVLGDNRNNSSDSRAWNEGKGGSAPLSQVLGRVGRLLAGVHRDGELDFSTLFRSIDAPLQAEGLDVEAVHAGIAKCLKERPKQTRPPSKAAASMSSVSAASVLSPDRVTP
jgi:signal peptidase I